MGRRDLVLSFVWWNQQSLGLYLMEKYERGQLRILDLNEKRGQSNDRGIVFSEYVTRCDQGMIVLNYDWEECKFVWGEYELPYRNRSADL